MTGLEAVINLCSVRYRRNLGDVDMFEQHGKFCFNIYVFLNSEKTIFSEAFLRKALTPLTIKISKVKINTDNEEIKSIVREFFKLE